MLKFKLGAIIREVPEGARKWYEIAGWKELKVVNNDKTNTKNKTT